MDWTVTVLLLLIGLSSCSQFPVRKYYYINMLKNWTEAQQYCREKYTDLATFESTDDINLLKPEFSYMEAWIGLVDDPKSWKGIMRNDSNSWRWSATGETSKTGYQIWDFNEPNNRYGKQTCVLFTVDGKWMDWSCQDPYRFICYTVTTENKKNYTLIHDQKTWSAAVQYCRDRHTELAMIENSEENAQVLSLVTSDWVWIGLYRVPWTWSDRFPSAFRNWYRNGPDNSQHCAVENHLHDWYARDCMNALPFICHQVVKLKTVVKLKMKTNADLTNSAVNEQILRQVAAMLRSQGFTDVNVTWKTPPSKQNGTEN